MTRSDDQQTLPVYVASGDERLFGVYHDVPPGAGAAVLICAPWGWEETASYRSRRAWAQRLAAAGHPVLRFDQPACGDSTGSPADPDRLAAWVAAVGDAAAWLRHRSGSPRLAVLGLGFGGLLAAAAAEAGAEIDELILWAVPSRGKRFVREQESFARMQAWGAGRGEESPLPEGWLEAGGFVLSAETIEELRVMAPPLSTVPSQLQRALLLDRDGMALDSGISQRLQAAGVETMIAPGHGWGKMVFHPEHAVFPLETVERVETWLGAAEEGREPPSSEAASPPPALDRLDFATESGAGHERPVAIPQSYGDSFAVIAEPDGERRGDFCAVFLNAGAVRHIGPNRNWVENARRWATRGIPTVRIDLEGIGEADGDRSDHPGVGGFYDEVYAAQVRTVIDALERRGLGPRFVCIGLCSGAFWSLHLADRDPRVEAAVMLNSGAIFWSSDLRSRRDARLLSGSLFSRDSWRKVRHGEVDLRKKAKFVGDLLRWAAKRVLRKLRGSGDRVGRGRDAVALFNRLRDNEKRIAMAFCANEPVLAELQRDGIPARLALWPNLELTSLVGEDHALGPIDAQRSAEQTIDRELTLALKGSEGAGPKVSTVPPARPAAKASAAAAERSAR